MTVKFTLHLKPLVCADVRPQGPLLLPAESVTPKSAALQPPRKSTLYFESVTGSLARGWW